jgi:hypothetical protein
LTAVRLGRWGIAAGVAVGLLAGSVAAADAEGRSRSYEARDNASGAAPARFVAEFDGRIVVVSAETGRAERYLTDKKPGGDASYPAVSPDGRTVWFSRGDGNCAAHLASVPVTGGKEKAVPGSGDAGPETVPLPRPRKAQLAYARIDCEKRDSAIVVGDLEGLEGRGRSGLVPIDWSRDGDLLLARTVKDDETRLLEINPAGGIESSTPLGLKDSVADCRLEVVGFSPDENDGYVALRRCGPSGERGRRSLVLLHRDGNLRKTVLRLPRGQDFTDRPVFDEIGHSLLYSTTTADRAGTTKGEPVISLWLWRDGETRRLERRTGFGHPAWLP